MMERKKMTNKSKQFIPDIINQSVTKEFTQVPNALLRNPELSFKAKGILCLLLSNKEGWYSYMATIKQMTREGDEAIRSGLAELERAGYLLRIQYREKDTKIRRGSFWAYTDIAGKFDMDTTLKVLDEQGMEALLVGKNYKENPNKETPDLGNPDKENQSLKILNIKRHKNKNNNSFSDPLGSDGEIDDNPSSNNTSKPSLQERNKEYIPYASKLAEIIQSNKNVKINGSKIKSWANEIRKLVESDRVNPTRIDTVLNWYQENIGGDYIPVVESGASFRNKFIRLEDAIKRNNGSHSNNVPNESNHESPEEIIAQEFQKNRIAQIFIRCCFLPAKKILTQTSNGQLPELARNLIDLRRYIHAEQKENRGKFSDMEQANIFPSPTGLIEDYIDWIQDNHWIEDKEPRLFTSRHKIFQKFLNYQRKLQNDRHPLTGE